MKKFFLFILIVGGLGAAGYYFYDPHLKPYIGPIVDKIAGKVDGTINDDKDKLVKEQAEKPPVTPKKEAPKAAPTPQVAKTTPKEAPKPAVAKSEIDKLVEAKYPMPNVKPLLEIVDNWNNVPRNAYPRFVTLKDNLAFTMTINGNKMASVAVPGTQVVPTSLQGSTLHVTSAANPAMRNQIDVDKTDFKDQISNRYAQFMQSKRTQIAALREKAKKALMASPEKVASLQANSGKWDQTGDPRFGPVKASIAGGKVKDVSIEEATSFRWNGSERIGGQLAGTYDTVTVHFEVSTIFGKFPTDYKCLLRGGQVVGWIDPVTDEKI